MDIIKEFNSLNHRSQINLIINLMDNISPDNLQVFKVLINTLPDNHNLKILLSILKNHYREIEQAIEDGVDIDSESIIEQRYTNAIVENRNNKLNQIL